ncbi:MAG: HlyD family efflux transporter periplasmic adaptor subunit [Clostridiales Family XIII bacterium]|nr:HlyD family efflux transporter periplasmic adaptor subunit [Clostridiales Family XIII bacterium]
MRKRSIRKWPFVLIAVGVAVVVGVVYVMPMLAVGSQAAQTANVVSVTAAAGDIQSTVVATGNLAAASEDIELPDDVSFDEVLVSADDEVGAGDTLATLNSTSISTAISNAKSALEEVQDSLEAKEYKYTDSVSVTSVMTARVKAVYGKAGKSVASIMKSKGALALLSTDGLMAVDVAAASDSGAKLSVGSSVTVALAGGTEAAGTVAKKDGDTITVTLTDNGPKLGDKATVKKGGKTIGEGELYIHAPLSVTESVGKIESVYAYENEKVYSGTSLFLLSVPEENKDYAILSAKQDDLLETLKELYALRTAKILSAPTSGVVSVVSDAAISVTRRDKVEVNVSVDELDVSAVEVGQQVDLTLDAIEGQTFSGVVTEVSDEGDTSGSAPKYATTIEADRADVMKFGMSATATIIKEKKEGVVVIPMDAVQEYGEEVYVFTELDESGLPAGETKIETGLSDGTNVEVVSGLSDGQTVYYTVAASTGNQNGAFMMGGVPGMGGEVRVRSGGDRPPSDGGSGGSAGGGDSGSAAPSNSASGE